KRRSAAESLRGGPAKDLGGRIIPDNDVSIRIDSNDGTRAGIDKRLEHLIRVQQFLGSLPHLILERFISLSEIFPKPPQFGNIAGNSVPTAGCWVRCARPAQPF